MSYDDWLFREADKVSQKRYSTQEFDKECIGDWVVDIEMAMATLVDIRETESLKLISPKGYESVIDAIEACRWAINELEGSYEEIDGTV